MNAQQHREAFRAAIADDRVCDCRKGSCPHLDCPLCTEDFIQWHPCPAAYPSIYYISDDTPIRLDGHPTVLREAAIRYGQCSCVHACTPDCPLCAATEETRCPHGRHVKLSRFEQSLRNGYESGELPCPHGGDACSAADGHWYHGDCEASAAARDPRRGKRFVCGHHGAHPHDGLTCARCSTCLAIDPNAINAAHDYGDLMFPGTTEGLRAEITRLRARIAELEDGDAAGKG